MRDKYDAMMRSVNANKELYCHTRDGLSWRIEPHKWFKLFKSKTKVRVIEVLDGRKEEYPVSGDPHESRTYISDSSYTAVVAIYTNTVFPMFGRKKYFQNRELAEAFIARQEAIPNEMLKPLCHDCGETYTWKMRNGSENTFCCE